MSVTYFGGPTLEVSVAFGKGATDTVVDGDYTDISAYVRDISIQRGRSSELDTFQAGTLTVVLDNRDRRFDPDYASSPYVGNLLPNRHIRVRMTYSGSTSYLFKGYVQCWPQAWEDNNRNASVTVVAHDWFKLANRTILAESLYAYEVAADTPALWWRLGEAADETLAADSSGNARFGGYSGTITPADGLVTYSSDGAHELGPSLCTISSGNYALSGTAFSIEFWVDTSATALPFSYTVFVQGDYVNGPYISVVLTGTGSIWQVQFQCTLTKSGGVVTNNRYILSGDATASERHHVVLTRTGTTFACYIDGVSTGTAATTGTFSGSDTNFGSIINVGSDPTSGSANPATVILDELALYAAALSSTRALAHYVAGSTAYAGDTVDARISRVLATTPYSTFPTSLSTSAQTVRGCDLAGTTLLAYLQNMEATEGGQGRLYVAADGTLTFRNRYYDSNNATIATAYSDASATLPYAGLEHEYDDTRVVNDATVSRTNGTAQRAIDTTSRTAYGAMALTVDGLAGQSDAECLDRANALVYQYKTPRKRIRSLDVLPQRAPATLYPAVRTADVSTRISVRRLPVGLGSAWTQELTIEGVAHSIPRDGPWTTSYLTAPADVAAEWFILDSATNGVLDTDRLGF